MIKLKLTDIVPHQNNVKISRYGARKTNRLITYENEITSAIDNPRACLDIFELDEDVNCIKMEVCFYFPIPKSLSKKEKAKRIGSHHTQTPDVSNVLKSFEDILFNHLNLNDKNNAMIIASKKWNNDEDDRSYYIEFNLSSLT